MKMSLTIFFLAFVLVSGALAQNHQLFEGEQCKEKDGVEWICKKLEECQSALQNIKHQKPEICGFSGLSAVVCCEPSSQGSNPFPTPARPSSTTTTPRTTTTLRWTTTSTTTRRPNNPPPPQPSQPPANIGSASISVQKCFEYAKSVYEKDTEVSLVLDPEGVGDNKLKDTCSRVEQALITDGSPTAPKEFPHQVNLGYRGSGNSIKWLCTGSLISENFVLSAAHCTKTSFGAPYWAVVGDQNIESDTEDARPVQLRIVQHIDHPKYRTEAPYHDLSLYRLEKNVIFDGYKRPACLNGVRFIQERQAIATGWGNTRTGGPSSAVLLKVRLDIINQTKCSEYWFKGGTLKNGIDDEKMICAGDLVGKKDTCSGDSGGPLQNSMTSPYCMYSIIGVTSFGRRDCGSRSPGVYTRVSHYLPWIESVVWP